MGADALTSGLEEAWTQAPTQWDNGFLDNLFGSSGSRHEPRRANPVDAHRYRRPGHWCPMPTSRRPPARPDDAHLRSGPKVDPIYAAIAKRFDHNPDLLAEAFAKAW